MGLILVTPEWFEEWYRQNFGDAAVVHPKELARVLGKSPETIYRYLRTAELESFKLGPRSYVIPKPALQKWMVGKYIMNTED